MKGKQPTQTNPNWQTKFVKIACSIGACSVGTIAVSANLAQISGFIFDFCDRYQISLCSHIKPEAECPPFIAPGEKCRESYKLQQFQ